MVARPRSASSTFAFWSGLFLLTVSVALGIFWRFTPLHQRIGLATISAAARDLQGHAWAPLAMMAVFAVGGLILFMHVVMLWTTVLIFDSWHALLYCELGTLASGITMYVIGRAVRPELARRLAGSYLDRVSQALARKGVLTLMVLHWFPICPFSVLNFIAGATHIQFRDFVVGTVVGCTPGLILLAFFGHQILTVLHGHRWLDALPIIAGVLAVSVAARYLRARLRGRLPARAA